MLQITGNKNDWVLCMNSEEIKSAGLRGRLLLNEPMSKHTTWRAGGTADRFYVPADIEDLSFFLSVLPDDEPLHWVGLGSNLLVRDGGLHGTVISTCHVLNLLEMKEPRHIRAGAGVTCAKVARFAMRHGLTGAEFLVGIPGTMGGALAMNAGAFGTETWDLIKCVEVINRRGERSVRTKYEFEIGYRKVVFPDEEWFVSAELELENDSDCQADNRIKSLLKQRSETQPIGEPSCGSVFRNPENDHAARLIEECGLKGMSVGDACVSKKHANFIINTGNASAGDIENLILHIQRTVRDKYQVELHTEVKIIGEKMPVP